MNTYQFPEFRRFANNKILFKVISNTEFFQINKIGSTYVQQHIVATTYPEKVIIRDILENENGRYNTCTSREYDEWVNLLT